MKKKHFHKSTLARIVAAAATALMVSASTLAAELPPIEVVTHAGAGGGTDVNSRMMMLRARRTLKQDMVVVNKRGGGGAAAMNYFLSRPADGNTILTFTVGHAITMAKGKTKLKVEDMAPLARGTNDPQILMVNCKTSPYKTPEAFVAGMKNGDKLKFGGTQTGTIDHITVYLWSKRLGVKMPIYIPFKGGGELATQLVAGAVDVGTLNLSEAAAPVEAGDICPLVILANKGMAPIPKAKTAKELGIDLVLSTTRGFVTHAGVDPARREALEKGILKAMQHSMYQAYLTNSGLDSTSPQPSGPWGEQIKAMVGEFGPALKEMGLVK
ncbi:MAG: tripartite tricarboxylate transporter substrate binding protein [Gammaproteobacteria bacterium]|nr:MAG: tripartite tricarboxylate transporter substrate binding protein [Gammaproteobacteria bacterium]